MNREIKFRGKQIGTNTWIYGSLIIYPDKVLYIAENGINTEELLSKCVDPNTVGQYTVLKDKNGKEIYEGDIVKTGNGRLWTVSFGNYQYYEDTPAVGFYLWSKLSVFPPLYGNIEIVGNVHENPEML